MSEVKTYTIRTVRDFFSVPPEKMQDMLKDFEMWLACHVAIASVTYGGVCAEQELGEFVWHDDGKHDALVKIRIGADQLKP